MNPARYESKNGARRSFHRIFLSTMSVILLINSTPLLAGESGEGEKSLEPLAWQTDLAVWTAVVFVILLAILWIFAFGPIVKALDLREKNELERLAAAEKNNADAKNLLEQYRQKLADSEDEVRKILSDARAEAQKMADAVVSEARQAAAGERERALKDIQTASDVALQEIAEKSADLVTSLAGKVIGEEVDSARHAQYIESAFTEAIKR